MIVKNHDFYIPKTIVGKLRTKVERDKIRLHFRRKTQAVEWKFTYQAVRRFVLSSYTPKLQPEFLIGLEEFDIILRPDIVVQSTLLPQKYAFNSR